MTKNPWSSTVKETITPTKLWLTDISIIVRKDQFRVFTKLMEPTKNSKVLDVGVTSDETLKDSNLFEKIYQYQNKITALTIEDAKAFKKLYPKVKVKKIAPHKKLPFKDKEFDIVTSWATIEHVGNYKKQEFFLNELLRVGKKVFVTSPYRGSFYEPHTGTFFLHWLPLTWFRKICNLRGLTFMAKEENLNPLYIKDIRKMKLKKPVRVAVYKTFKILPTHLIISSSKNHTH